jgi:hypothetical protein
MELLLHLLILLGITIIFEILAIVIFYPDRKAYIKPSIALNAITNPMLNLIITICGFEKYLYLGFGARTYQNGYLLYISFIPEHFLPILLLELGVIALEAYLYKITTRKPTLKCIHVSIVTNLFSWLIGSLVYDIWLSPIFLGLIA